MNSVNKTLYIPLYGKAMVSRQKIILRDPAAERIWAEQEHNIILRGKSKSKWLCYNMAMRARIFDDWTNTMLLQNSGSLVLHIGCGLDSRCNRVNQNYHAWYDCDFPDVIEARKKYYEENERYHMIALNAADSEQIKSLPQSDTAIIIFEGISMYLTNDELHNFFSALEQKYGHLHVLMDVYTMFGAKASKFKNPINDVGVTKVFGIDDIDGLLAGLKTHCIKEHSLTPENLVNEIPPRDRRIFKMLFTGKLYRKIYRLFELEKI